MSKLTIDLHDIYNKGDRIDSTLEDALQQAEQKGIKEIEIIPGKGTGQLKKRVQRFFRRNDVKNRYKRFKNDPKNSGRIFVYF